jgi:Spondin_N
VRKSSTSRWAAWLPAGVLTLVPGAAVAQVADTAEYAVRFQATWSAVSHPVDFPSNAHFSPLVGGLHDGSVSFWQPGAAASEGIEQMAERGRTTPLDLEVGDAVATGGASQVLVGSGIGRSPGMTSLSFTASRDHPLVTLVSMLAPSPDWFVGVSGLSLFESGNWVEQRVITLYTYDAGTDSGVTYTSANADAVPPEPIHMAVSGPFAGGRPVGTFTFVRQDGPPPQPLLLGGGRFRIEAEWQDFGGIGAHAHPVQLTDDTGYFWFFEETNVEVVIKVLDGCGFNDRYWVFAGGLTNVALELTVEDTTTGQTNVYANPLGAPFQPIQDLDAFATCP